VKDGALHLPALRDVAVEAQRLGYAVRGACPSPLPGTEGNREFFLHLLPGEQALAADELEARLGKVACP
jgi:23S rRNA (cytidine1920-2'-O)/16S rRNA (cytidine1409-2'-O)-methyltransferase